MKKILLIFCIPLLLFSVSYAVEEGNAIQPQIQESLDQVKDYKFVDNTLGKKEQVKKEKKSKIKSFFKKLNPFKKTDGEFGLYIIAFLLGFLFALIGILIAFLIFLKHPNRKKIMSFAWIGWLWWLVILTIILL